MKADFNNAMQNKFPGAVINSLFVSLVSLAALVFLTTAAVAEEGKLYKWVDEDGNVTYQDSPPPDSGGEVQTFSERSGGSAPAATMPDVDIVLYSIQVCDACDLVRKLLVERGIPFEEKNADNDVEVQAEIKEVADVLSVPVLTLGDQVLTGYNRELILNELEEIGFDPNAATASSRQQSGQQGGQLSREDLESMSQEEVEQAARDAALRGEDNDLFDEDEGFAFNEDIFSDDNGGSGGDDIGGLEEIPEDERIQFNQ